MHKYNVGHPLERIAMDLAGPFPMSQRGNHHTLVMADYLANGAKHIQYQPHKIFVENWISHYGVSLELHTDQGRNFELNLFLKLCQLLKINKTRTSAPSPPPSDGMVERFNRILLQHLSQVVNKHQEDWDHYIPLFMLAYRSAIYESTIVHTIQGDI